MFDAFVALMLVAEPVLVIEFRSPARLEVLIPLMSLFSRSIFLTGAHMYRIDRRPWAVTAATTVALLFAMAYAIGEGVG